MAFATPVSSSSQQAISKAAIVAAARTPTTTPAARQWTAPWGNHGGNDFINIFPHNQYCLKYGGKHDDLAPFVVNQHGNGLLTPLGYNATHNVPQLTIEDYVNSRYVLNPLRLWDCDRPVNASAAYLFTTAERARDMRQSPVYVLNHSQHNFRQRTTQPDLDEIEDWTDRAARRMYEGAGLGPNDVGIFNPYDGYAPMAQFFLEGFQWHAVKRGDAFAFYADNIRGRGTAPLERRQSRDRALPFGHVHRQHRAAPRHGRSGFGQRLRWRHSPRQAMPAGSCSANTRADGL
jgi:hypothetical protein